VTIIRSTHGIGIYLAPDYAAEIGATSFVLAGGHGGQAAFWKCTVLVFPAGATSDQRVAFAQCSGRWSRTSALRGLGEPIDAYRTSRT
jgi:hypothetical protein